MAQALCIKDGDCAFILKTIFELKEELSELKVGMQKMGRCLGLDLLPLDPTLEEKVPIPIPLDEGDYKSCKSN